MVSDQDTQPHRQLCSRTCCVLARPVIDSVELWAGAFPMKEESGSRTFQAAGRMPAKALRQGQACKGPEVGDECVCVCACVPAVLRSCAWNRVRGWDSGKTMGS